MLPTFEALRMLLNVHRKRFERKDRAPSIIRKRTMNGFPSMTRLAFWCSSLTILVWPVVANATTVEAMNLERMVRSASVIFAGTVSSIEAESRPPRNFPVTRVAFSKVSYVKGHFLSKRAILRLYGNGSTVTVTGTPRFDREKRYVVIANEDTASVLALYLPIVGHYQGFFPVESEVAGASPVVHDASHRPLVRATAKQIVVVDSNVAPSIAEGPARGDSVVASGSTPTLVVGTMKDPGTRVSEDEFLELLRRIAKAR